MAAVTFLAACGETRVPKLEGDALNPESHRAFIVTVDAIVFEDGPLDAENRDRLSKTFLAVSGIASTDPANTIALAFGRELKRMSSMAESTRVGTPMRNSPLRNNWLRIRNGLFADAAWYRYSSRDPVEPAVAGPPPPSPLRPANDSERVGLDQVMFSLGALVERAKRDLPNSSDSEPHKQFVVDAERELAVDEVRLGPQPPKYGIDVYYQDAYKYAAEAYRTVKTLVGLGTGAPTSTREYLIKKAEEHLEKARMSAGQMRK